MSHQNGIAALKWRQSPRVASPITSLRLPGLGVGEECLDLPRKVIESSLSEGREFALAAVNWGAGGGLAGLWGLRGGREEQRSCYSGQGFMTPFPPIGAVERLMN